MAAGQDSTIDVRGTKVLVRRGGAGQSLLFLHGTNGLSGWIPALERLASSFSVIAPDHPGFGRSTEHPSIDSVADLANFTLDLIDALDLSRVHVVGHQIGGWAALELAMRSSRIASLTLANAAGVHSQGVEKGDFFICRPHELPALFFTDEKRGAEILENEFAGQDEAIPHRNRVMAAKLAWHPRLIDPSLPKWLHRIKVPTHIVWGDADKVLPLPYAHTLAKHIAHAKLSVIAKCGHMSHLEQPELFARSVADFIKDLR